MKRFLAGIVLAVFFVAATNIYAGAAEAKIGFVDLSRVFDEYQKTKEFDKVLSEKENSYKAEMEKKLGEVKQLEDKMAVLSAKEKEAKQAEMGAKYKAAQDYDATVGANLRKERNDKIREILKDIEGVVGDIAAKDGYDLVLNDRVLVYNNKQNKGLDLTEKILQAVNSQYKK